MPALTDPAERNREQRARAAAARLGLLLEKSRARRPHNPATGTYQLVQGPRDRHWRGGELVAGDHQRGFGLTLDQIERELADIAAERDGDTGSGDQ